MVLIAGGAVALIVAVGVIAVVALGTGGKPSPQTNAPGSATPTSAAGTCAFLKPGSAVAAGLGSGSCALLGSSLAGGQIAGARSSAEHERAEGDLLYDPFLVPRR